MITELNGDFQALNDFIRNIVPSKLFFLVDENTHEHCLPELLANLETDTPFEILEIESGESMKNIETCAQLWSILCEFQADRKCLIINIGGGVITDLGGFVASTYKRGVAFVHIPTTLLGMCDASIGGKTGIDHAFLKNSVGTFSLPERVFFFPDFLRTLPLIEFRSGFAEMLKHGLVADKNHWEALISIPDLTFTSVAPYIGTSMMIKQRIIQADFTEQSLRKILNFGHTVGHAVEALFMQRQTPKPHGEMVALGMVCETKISELEGLINAEVSSHVIEMINRFFPHININLFSDKEILSLMKNDKKNTNGTINFVLIDGIGTSVFDYKVKEERILEALDFYRRLPGK